jgi:hypothetical protein
MKLVPTYELLLWERTLQLIPPPSLVNFFSRGTVDRSVHRDAFPQLPGNSRLRLRRRRVRWSGRATHSALHLFVEEVSPVIHHRLKTMVREPATAAWIRTTAAALRRSLNLKYPQSSPLTEMYEQGASPWL